MGHLVINPHLFLWTQKPYIILSNWVEFAVAVAFGFSLMLALEDSSYILDE
jgi:hypothetical protein